MDWVCCKQVQTFRHRYLNDNAQHLFGDFGWRLLAVLPEIVPRLQVMARLKTGLLKNIPPPGNGIRLIARLEMNPSGNKSAPRQRICRLAIFWPSVEWQITK